MVPPSPADGPVPTVGRRTLLVTGGWLGLALVGGCGTVDPRVADPTGAASTGSSVPGSPAPSGASPAPSTPAAPAFPGATAGADVERRLAGAAAGILTTFRRRLGDRSDLLAGVRDAHRAHAAALLGPDPTARTPASSVTVPAVKPRSGESLDAALARLVRDEQRAAAGHRRRSLGASGDAALLWGSMAISAATFAGALGQGSPPGVSAPKALTAMRRLSDVQAMQQVVAQQHAMVYGYQLAIGQLKVRSDGYRRAVGRLAAIRRQRDTIVEILLDRAVPVPDPAAAYMPSTKPTNPSRAAKLARQLETRFTPFCGQWLAAADQSHRAAAYANLQATVSAARSWGAPPMRWPGYLV